MDRNDRAQTPEQRAPGQYILYSEDSSPFSAPVRIAIYAKDLPIAIEPPPGGLKSSRYHAINPIGTIPCLVRADGFRLPESAAIMEFLDETFPTPSLLPDDADARGRVRLLQRIGELGVMTSCVDLLAMVDTPQRDDLARSARLTRLVRALASLEVFLGPGPFAFDNQLTLADCQLAPALSGVPLVTRAFGTGDLIAAYPHVAAYYGRCVEHPAVKRVLDEMTRAHFPARRV